MLRTFWIVCTLLTMMSSVSAHEGHGHPEHQTGILHYVVNPSHAIPAVLLGIAVLTAAFFILKSRKSRGSKHE